MSDYDNTNQDPAGNPVDELIGDYADQLQNIYDQRTAGDYTFAGVLAAFARDLQKVGKP